MSHQIVYSRTLFWGETPIRLVCFPPSSSEATPKHDGEGGGGGDTRSKKALLFLLFNHPGRPMAGRLFNKGDYLAF